MAAARQLRASFKLAAHAAPMTCARSATRAGRSCTRSTSSGSAVCYRRRSRCPSSPQRSALRARPHLQSACR
eukprot:10286582-Alexandrium_andersonii.AAC.1